MKLIDNYKLMTTNELIEKDRRLTELYWRIANEITMKDGYDIHEKSTDLLEVITEQINIIEGLMMERSDLLDWPESIIQIYNNRNKLTICDGRQISYYYKWLI